jgi:hypothetical protein
VRDIPLHPDDCSTLENDAAPAPPARPPVVDYPDRAELAGLTIERTNDRVAFHILPRSFRQEFRDAARLLFGMSVVFATLTATIITIALEQKLLPGEWLKNLMYVSPFFAFSFVILLWPLTYWCIHRRLYVEVDPDELSMTMHSLLPTFRMTWSRRRITRLHRDSNGIWVYVDGSRAGRIACPSSVQDRLLLRALCTELHLQCHE